MATIFDVPSRPSMKGAGTFQIASWFDQDEDRCDDTEPTQSPLSGKEYVMYITGSTAKGEAASVRIRGYKPYFYVKVPTAFNDLTSFLDFTKKKMGWKENSYADCLLEEQCQFVHKMDLYGFNNWTKFKFVKLVFHSAAAMGRARYIFRSPNKMLRDIGVPIPRIYEGKLDPYISYCHERDIHTTGWVYTPSDNVMFDEIVPKNDILDMAPFTEVSFDLETYSHDGSFTRPQVKEHTITQCGFWAKTPTRQFGVVLNLGPCDDLDNEDITLIRCETERELLVRIAAVFSRLNPDFIYGYNIDKFDFEYLAQRAIMYGTTFAKNFLRGMSRIRGASATLDFSSFSSKAYGSDDYKRLRIPGRTAYDLLIHYQRTKKYSNHKLQTISQNVLGHGKDDVSPADMFRYFRNRDAAGMRLVALYCALDCKLCQELVDEEDILTGGIQLSDISWIPLQYILTKGQSAKVMSLIVRGAHSVGYLVPDTVIHHEIRPVKLDSDKGIPFKPSWINCTVSLNRQSDRKYFTGKIMKFKEPGSLYIKTFKEVEEDKKTLYRATVKNENDAVIGQFTITSLTNLEPPPPPKYIGGLVLDPVKGLYTNPMLTWDFEGLYPSIDRGHNGCLSTVVIDPKYANIEGVKYETYEWDDPDVSSAVGGTCQKLLATGKNKNTKCKHDAFTFNDGMRVCRQHNKRKRDDEPQRYIRRKVSIVQSTDHPAPIPMILEGLYNQRVAEKKAMKASKAVGDKRMAAVHNQRQLGVKITQNSVYGFLGRASGDLSMQSLGMTITFLGRSLIQKCQNYVNSGEFQRYVAPMIPIPFKATVVYGDTDSVFISVVFESGDEDTQMKLAFQMSELGAEHVTTHVINRYPIKLESEKIGKRTLLIQKKQYIMLYCDDPKNPTKESGPHFSGIATDKRNYCAFVQECYKNTISDMLNGRPFQSRFESCFEELMNGQVSSEKLIMTSNVSAVYTCKLCERAVSWKTKGCPDCKNVNIPYDDKRTNCHKCNKELCTHQFNLAQANLAHRLTLKGTHVEPNTRISFIFAKPDDPSRKQYECSERVEDYERLGMQYNVGSYLNSLSQPILAFLKQAMDNIEYENLRERHNDLLKAHGGKRIAK